MQRDKVHNEYILRLFFLNLKRVNQNFVYFSFVHAGLNAHFNYVFNKCIQIKLFIYRSCVRLRIYYLSVKFDCNHTLYISNRILTLTYVNHLVDSFGYLYFGYLYFGYDSFLHSDWLRFYLQKGLTTYSLCLLLSY